MKLGKSWNTEYSYRGFIITHQDGGWWILNEKTRKQAITGKSRTIREAKEKIEYSVYAW